MDRKKAFNKQKLWLAFKHFDTEKKNYLTRDGLKKVFMREGKNYSDDEIDGMLVEGATIGCFPNLYGALSRNMPDQVITL